MDQNDAVAIYKKSYHELSLFGEAPVCSSTIIGSEAYVLPGLTNSPVGPSPDSVAQRVAAESWVAHMVCCGWYLCASLQTAVPSLGRGWWDLGRPNLLDPFRMGKCRRIQENAIVTGSCFVSNLNPKKDPNFDVAWFKKIRKMQPNRFSMQQMVGDDRWMSKIWQTSVWKWGTYPKAAWRAKMIINHRNWTQVMPFSDPFRGHQ